jgi:hypothetical protein
MSEAKIDENVSNSLIANGDKEDEALNNSVSDGEIIDDDEPEELKTPIISFPQRKIPKNFRTRHEKSDSDDEIVGKIGKNHLDLISYRTYEIEFFQLCLR